MFRFTSFKSTLHILLVSSLLIAASLVPKPVSAQDILPNPAAEAYLLDELRFGGYADLQNFSENAEARGVSGAALLNILIDPDVQQNSSIYIVNATITDSLSAIDLISSADLVFHQVEFAGDAYFGSSKLEGFEAYNSTFMGDLTLSSSSINGQVNLANNTFHGMVDFGTSVLASYTNITNNTFQNSLTFLRATLNGNVDLRDNIIHESLNFYGAHVIGELLLDGSQILGTEAMPGTSFPTEFWSTTVEGPASFSNVVFGSHAYFAQSNFSKLDMYGAAFNGDVSFNGTVVEHSANFPGAQFSGAADFSDIQIGRDVLFEGATFNGEANFRSASVARDANFTGASFHGPADFYYFESDRYVDFLNAMFDQDIWFSYATIGYLYFQETVFNGPVSFFGLRVTQAIEFIDCTYNYAESAFQVKNVSVAGTVKFSGMTAQGGLDLSDSQFGELSVSTKDNPNIEFINITASEIDGSLRIENVTMKSFLAEGVSIGESTSLLGVKITDKLDLRNTEIGFLKVDTDLAWPNDPQDPQNINLRGMTYLDIDMGDQGLTEDTWPELLRFVNESAYSPQAYQALSQFLTDKGHPDWAAQVNLEQKRRERRDVLVPFSGQWLWSWFLDIFSGYGYLPARAFIWSGLVILIGAMVFRRREHMLPVEQDDAQLEYNPVWYSFSLFLPYIDLGIASKWEPNPERRWARNYKYVHMMLGWILAPIALLAFGGAFG